MSRKRVFIALPFAILLGLFILSPVPRFEEPLSTVVEAGDGSLLGARIASDGQWRFPPPDSVPYKFEKALLTFEDRYFHVHPGVNPYSIGRAFVQNIRAGTVVSGGSTITMQVARIAGGVRGRTYLRKLMEIMSALKLELLRSKKEILITYCANAPFGGNIVGLEAASWKYGGTSPYNMSWAEAATYAVLPNSPALVHPGRNRETLAAKRNRLLTELYYRGYFDTLTLVLSLEEPLLPEADPLPSHAPHLTDFYHLTRNGERIKTTINYNLQIRCNEFVNSHSAVLSSNEIHNAAAIVIDVNSGDVLAYVGNSIKDSDTRHGCMVDIIRAERSTGSILKPLLYAGMLSSGDILPNSILPDIPIRYPGFAPKNFNGTFSGAVPASTALSRSLNVPAVKMLQDYTPERFHLLLNRAGLTSFGKSPDHYGLSMILGGGEASLWELAGMYASMARVVNRFNREQRYRNGDYHPPVLEKKDQAEPVATDDEAPVLDAGSLWLTFNALREVNRPDSESGWQFLGSSPEVAWKTGTSYGFRDAWAIATTPSWVIGVWAGNADGEGRPGLTGIGAAAPLLFDIVSDMRPDGWFERPAGDQLTLAEVCSQSGFRAGPDCTDTREEWVPINGLRSVNCPYHVVVHINPERTRRVNSSCFNMMEIINEKRFVLPPAMEYYFRKSNISYRPMPPLMAGCSEDKAVKEMEFIYPPQSADIFIPRDHTGSTARFVAEAVHRERNSTLFWHLDEEFLGKTSYLHQMDIFATEGEHKITIIDAQGHSATVRFRIVGGTN